MTRQTVTLCDSLDRHRLRVEPGAIATGPTARPADLTELLIADRATEPPLVLELIERVLANVDRTVAAIHAAPLTPGGYVLAPALGRRIPIIEDPHLPLTERDSKTGTEREVACRLILGRLHFHPQRLAQLRSEIAWRDHGKAAALGRWADEGGREP